MELASCYVVYLDKRAQKDRYEVSRHGPDSKSDQGSGATAAEPEEVRGNVCALLSVFNSVHICNSGVVCLTKVRDLDSIAKDCTPTLIFLDVEEDESVPLKPALLSPLLSSSDPSKSPALSSLGSPGGVAFYGLGLLKHFSLEIAEGNLSKLTVPIAFAHSDRRPIPRSTPTANGLPPASDEGNQSPSNQPLAHRPSVVAPARIITYLQEGAIDVVQAPFTKERLEALAVHGYRAHIEGVRTQPAFLESMRMRKRSWVGVDEEKPYAYLRESMVSSLMSSICKPEGSLVNLQQSESYYISPEREDAISKAIGRWAFPAHDFSEEELVHAAFIILQHALAMPELQKWRIPDTELKAFLMGCRSAYNSFVLYHNFRHVIDVLQAVFYFLVQIGTLPPYPSPSSPSQTQKPISPIADLLKPFDAFVLLVSAIGHDVGHPGVNNAFLVALKAPLAQLYNDSSVLEAFHCAAYSQILRRYWRVAFDDVNIRRLLIKSILATDMQLHFKYMLDLGNLQEKLHHNKGTDGWNDKILEEYKILACGLLIKCADISNVARPFTIAAKWSEILQKEFARQGEMERHVGIPTTLFGGPPELGNLKKLADSQIGFMNIFAYPLFEAVADILPAMQFGVEEIKLNQAVWKLRIEQSKQQDASKIELERYITEGFQSPRSGSPNRVAHRSLPTTHQESAPDSPLTPTNTTTQEMPAVGGGIDQTLQDAQGPRNPAQSQDPSKTELFRRSSSALPLTQITNMVSGQSQPTSVRAAQTNFDEASRETTGTAAFNESIFAGKPVSSNPSTDPIAGTVVPGPPSPKRAQRNGEPEPSAAQSPAMDNFSRPRSHRPSVQTSSTDRAPIGRSNRAPSSPGDSQATSFLTEGSDGTADAPEVTEGERPGSGTSSGGVSGGQASSTEPGAGGHGSPGKEHRGGTSKMNGHVAAPADKAVRKKGSKWRLFWRGRPKSGEASP